MKDVLKNTEIIECSGYELKAHFTLPDSDWWDHYYTPLQEKLPSLYEKYAGDDQVLGVIDMTAREIEIRKRFGDSYGYEFFVCKRTD